MTFKEKFEGIDHQNQINVRNSLLEKIKGKVIKSFGEQNAQLDNKKNLGKELPDIKKIPPSKKEIITILDSCINNNRDNIINEDIEEYSGDQEYENHLEKYRENYFLLLKGFKRHLIKNISIIDRHGAEILKHLESIQSKKELTLYQINILAEFIFRSYEKPYSPISYDEFINWGIGEREHTILDFIVNS